MTIKEIYKLQELKENSIKNSFNYNFSKIMLNKLYGKNQNNNV